jgi:hypothetical protein
MALVDDEDADLADVRWNAARDRNTFYARRNTARYGKRTTEYMHRVIMSRMLGRPLQRHEQVDHVDHDGLNNRRSNLRLASNRENLCNRRPGASSKYPGVSRKGGKWEARIRCGGRQKRLGYFTSESEAAEAYRLAAEGMVRKDFLERDGQ